MKVKNSEQHLWNKRWFKIWFYYFFSLCQDKMENLNLT